MLEEQELLIVLAGFFIAFVLAFGIGANDVANSFGTSVGSGVITLRSACILATFCEILGAVLLGSQVSKTMRSDIVDLGQFNDSANGDTLLIYGQISALSSACIWLIVATALKFPVSGTHSIVGATAGFGMVIFGINGVQWMGILKIAISWVASPVLSGLVSTIMFFILKKVVLIKEYPLEPALLTLPFLYGVVILINVFSVLFGLSYLKSLLPIWGTVVASIVAGLLTGIIVYFFVIPYLRRKILRKIELDKEREINGWDGVSTGGRKSKILNILRSRVLPIILCFRLRNKNASDATFEVDENQPDSIDSIGTTHKHHVALPDASSKRNKARGDITTSNLELLRTVTSESSFGGNKSIEKDGDDGYIGPNFMDLKTDLPTSNEFGNTDADDSSFSDDLFINDQLSLQDRPEEAHVFSFAQILTATFGSFAHGGNDVSNAIGPLIGLWMVATTGDVLNEDSAPIWILLYGGVGISVGLWIWGRRVIETVGEDLSKITPSSGVCIEIGSALTVLIASKVGIPVSTTHCKVGSVICVGRFRAKENVNWRLFVNIIVAWVVTLPIAAGLSALMMYIFTQTTLKGIL